MSDLEGPEGIERRHIHEASGSRLQSWPVGLAGLGLLLGASLLGWFGTEARLTDAGDGIVLSVEGPARIRNGEFFEMVMTVETDRPISDLVLVVDDDLWRDVTVNTLIPAAAEEGYRAGAFELRFGPREAGSRLVVKVDGQVNPDHTASTNRGTVALVDGDGDGEPLARVDFAMEVLP